MFVHLHGHSHYSLLKALGQPKKIVEYAKSQNMPAIAITDYENLYGAIEFYESCIKNEIKPIIGAEINFTLNFNTLRFSKKITTNYITLLAKNYEGYKNLIKLISIAQTKGLYKDIPYIDLTILEKYKDNLFLILGGANSRIGELITQDKKTDIIQEYIEKLINILGKENIILEIQPHPLPNYQKINKTLRNIGKKLNLFFIVNNNFHYIKPDEKDALGILKAIEQNEFYEAPIHNPKEDWHIMSQVEIENLLKNYDYIDPLIIENNIKLTDQINIQIPLGQILFPKYEVRQDRKQLYEKYKNQLIDKT